MISKHINRLFSVLMLAFFVTVILSQVETRRKLISDNGTTTDRWQINKNGVMFIVEQGMIDDSVFLRTIDSTMLVLYDVDSTKFMNLMLHKLFLSPTSDTSNINMVIGLHDSLSRNLKGLDTNIVWYVNFNPLDSTFSFSDTAGLNGSLNSVFDSLLVHRVWITSADSEIQTLQTVTTTHTSQISQNATNISANVVSITTLDDTLNKTKDTLAFYKSGWKIAYDSVSVFSTRSLSNEDDITILESGLLLKADSAKLYTKLNNDIISYILTDTTGATISGSKITLDGNVTVQGTFTLGGTNITDGTITASDINVSDLFSENITLTGFIQSNDFVTGVSGWKIPSSGTAEFQNVKVRSATGSVIDWTHLDNVSIVNADIEYLDASKITSGYIQSDRLVADSITVGTLSGITITGGTVQTASSGQRVVLNGSTNTLDFYDASGSVGTLSGNSSYLTTSGNFKVTDDLIVGDSVRIGWGTIQSDVSSGLKITLSGELLNNGYIYMNLASSGASKLTTDYFTANNNVTISGSLTLGTDLAIADGGTGASTASAARTNLGLDNYLDLDTYPNIDTDSTNDLTTTTNFSGDVSGTYNAIVVADDLHNHIISNVDNLQASLDNKLDHYLDINDDQEILIYNQGTDRITGSNTYISSIGAIDSLANLENVTIGTLTAETTYFLGYNSLTGSDWIAMSKDWYSQSDLQTSGLASVHWDNVTNAPAFITDGNTNWDNSYSFITTAGEADQIYIADTSNIAYLTQLNSFSKGVVVAGSVLTSGYQIGHLVYATGKLKYDIDGTGTYYNAASETWVNAWTGTSNISTVGSISVGTWNGNTIDEMYLDADLARDNETWSANATLSDIGSGVGFADKDVWLYDSAPSGEWVARQLVKADISDFGTYLIPTNNLSDINNATTARANLGLAIGTDVHEYHLNLTTLSGLTYTDGNFIVGAGGTWAVESGATARTSLGLGSLATLSSVNDGNWSGTDLAIANGGTGASTASGARTNLGLGEMALAETSLDLLSGAAPTGGNNGDVVYDDDTGKIWIKISGTWRQIQ